MGCDLRSKVIEPCTQTEVVNIHQKSTIASLALILAAVVGNPAQAATAKVGGTCTKVGAKAGTKSKPLVCTRTKKVLRWTVVAKKASVPKDTIAADTVAADTTVAH